MNDYEALKAAYEKMMDGYNEFNTLLRQMDKQLYERWKAGGKDISGEFVSMYPTANDCLDRLEPTEEEEKEESEKEESEVVPYHFSEDY